MKSTLLLGVHSHQPIDNFDHVVLDATAKSYQPFFETIAKTPEFKCSVHYSGWLLEFISKHNNKLFNLMKDLTKKGQIEWLTGGFYEPILASIPSYYRKLQIKKLSNFIKKHFNQMPKGLWLTERVWDASIIADLIDAGVEYAIVDDYHIVSAGVKIQNGYYITENGGNKLALFPISKALRYQIPFWEHEVVVENVSKLNGAAIIFDDGEKFGLWPGTHEWVYEKGWLDNFAKGTVKSLNCQTYYEFFRSNPPVGLVYPPEVSYFEMGEWSLSLDDAKTFHKLKDEFNNTNRSNEAEKFLRGSTWKNFLTKYPESNRIHKRILELSAKSIGKTKSEEAIMKAQCNDVLWHGIFGGLYLPNLRDNAWTYIIECENLLNPKNGLDLIDYNFDGIDEARFTTDTLFATFEATGAMLSELDLRSRRFNLLNTLKRRIEAYHQNIEAKEEKPTTDNETKTIHHAKLYTDESDLTHIIEDKNLRGGFIDHIVKGEFNLERFFAQDFNEQTDLANSSYKISKNKNRLQFKSDLITKFFSAEKNTIRSNIEIGIDNAHYVQEHNFHFADAKAISINNQPVENASTSEAITKVEIYDPYLKTTIILEANEPFLLYTHILSTVSQSESGVDLTSQGISMALDFQGNAQKISVALVIKE